QATPAPEPTRPAPARPAPATPAPRAEAARAGLNFSERKRLETLPAVIERLEAEIDKLTEFLAQPDLFQTAPAKFAKASDALVERQQALAAAEEEWLDLAERDQG
ncbi:ABC transporter C-terminal domain-containing protein, partial [Paracoccus versutus]